MKTKKIICSILLVVLFSGMIHAQGVAVNPTGAQPASSAGLDVDFPDKGLLIPRMTNAERDAIVNPAEGLKIYNTETKCENFFTGTQWRELCGTCVPIPTTADAGADQVVNESLSTFLNANTPANGTAQWSIISGSGGNIVSASNPTTMFTGLQNTSYVLRWSIITACGTSQDDVSVLFAGASKKVFVSSTTTTGNYGGLAGADNHCQALASGAGLSGTYIAWLSSSSVNAISRLTPGFAFARTDGAMVAFDITDLTDGQIINPIDVDEYGNTVSSTPVFTGSTTAGVLITNIYPTYLSGHCNNWTCACEGAATHLAGTGISSSTDGTWTQAEEVVGYGCSNAFRLYCFEQ